MIAALREEARLPFRTIKWYLDTVHGLRLSTGAIVDATQRVARRAQAVMAGILKRIRGSPVVHADETGWLAGGRTQRLCVDFQHAHPAVLPEARTRQGGGGRSAREPVCWRAGQRFYAAYHHYDGPKQRCWAHLLRDIHHLRALYPEDDRLVQWADAVHQLYCQAKAYTHPQAKQRRIAQLALERQLLVICQPFLHDTSATQAKLCRRIECHIKELFVFVAEPEVPPDNNAAERSLRHLVVSRKVSGGTRSERGSDSKMTLASLFGTWRVQGLNPLTTCRQLLSSPQF